MGLSIIIPVYNAEEYLSQCLDSILVCKEKELEIILINDGSNDNSPKICEQYQSLDGRVKFYSQKNKGVSVARNYGLEKASKNKIMFLDADDFINPEKWDIILKYANANYEFVGFSYDSYVNEKIKPIPEYYPFSGTSCVQKDKIIDILFGTPLLHVCWGKIFDLKAIQNYKCSFPVDVPIGEDYMFVIDYLMQATNIILVNERIVYYRQTPNGAMRTFRFDVRTSGMNLIWNKCYKWLKQSKANDRIWENFYLHQFKTYTKHLREIAGNYPWTKTMTCYRQLFENPCFLNTIKELQVKKLPLYKKIEYQMIKRKLLVLLACYFKLKSRVRR